MKNEAQLIGYVGQDPTIEELESGSKVANFSLATSDSWTDSSGKKVEDTQWHKIVAWGKKVDIVEQYFKKGDFIGLRGKIVYETYTNKDGIKVTVTKIRMKEFVFLRGNGSNSGQEPEKGEATAKTNGKKSKASKKPEKA